MIHSCDYHLYNTYIIPSIYICILIHPLVRSVDFNPNKPCMLISAGNDQKVKFWDTRELSRPVRVLAGHSHWVSTAKYNPYHDQLVVR